MSRIYSLARLGDLLGLIGRHPRMIVKVAKFVPAAWDGRVSVVRDTTFRGVVGLYLLKESERGAHLDFVWVSSRVPDRLGYALDLINAAEGGVRRSGARFITVKAGNRLAYHLAQRGWVYKVVGRPERGEPHTMIKRFS